MDMINIYNDLSGLLVECDSLAHKNGIFLNTMNSPRFAFRDETIKADLILQQIRAGIAINFEHFYGSKIARHLRSGIEDKADEFKYILWEMLLSSSHVIQAHQLLYYYSVTLAGVDEFAAALNHVNKELLQNTSAYDSTLLRSAILMGASHAGIVDAAEEFKKTMHGDHEFASIFVSFIARNYYGSINDLALDYANKILANKQSQILQYTRLPVLEHLKNESKTTAVNIIDAIL